MRGELESGRYRAGKALPSVAELRERFGAGEFAVRAALHKLRDDGFVKLVQRVGSVVTLKSVSKWRGCVAFIRTGVHASYFPSMLSVVFARRFIDAGFDFVTLAVPADGDGNVDIEPISRLVANGVSFVVGLFESNQIGSFLHAAEVPYVVLGWNPASFPGARAVILPETRSCYDAFARTLHDLGLKTILEFDYERRMDRSFKSLLCTAGISVTRVMCDNGGIGPSFPLRDIRRCGHRIVSRYFENTRHRSHLPDVVLFDDDYFADGGIVALLEAGIRIPEDIKLVTYSNKGNELVLGMSVARIECDPVSYADAVSEYVIGLLASKAVAPPKISLRFVPGDSLTA